MTEIIHVVSDWEKYQLEGYHILSQRSKQNGAWDEFGDSHLVVLNPIEKDGSLWVRHDSDIKAVCHTLGAAEAARRLFML
jgi:hypothetical protein